MTKPVTAFMDKDGQDWEVRDDDSVVRIIPFVILVPDAAELSFAACEGAVLVNAAEDATAADIAEQIEQGHFVRLNSALATDDELNQRARDISQDD